MVKQSHYTPGVAQRVPESYISQITWQWHRVVLRLSALRTGRLYPQEMFLVFISVRGWVDPRIGQSFWITLYNHKGCIYRAPERYLTKPWSVVLLNTKARILLSEVYCVWQVVKTPTIISNNPVLVIIQDLFSFFIYNRVTFLLIALYRHIQAQI